MAEMRSGKRFPLELPIEVGGQSAAVTGNVSAAGVYVLADSKMEVGTEIDFELTLPAAVLGSGTDVKVRCHGRVVRHEKRSRSGQPEGYACIIDHYKFVRG